MLAPSGNASRRGLGATAAAKNLLQLDLAGRPELAGMDAPRIADASSKAAQPLGRPRTGRTTVAFNTWVSPDFKAWLKAEFGLTGKTMVLLLDDMRTVYEDTKRNVPGEIAGIKARLDRVEKQLAAGGAAHLVVSEGDAEIDAFIARRLELVTSEHIAAGALFQVWKDNCAERGCGAGSQKAFSNRIGKRIRHEGNSGRPRYLGVCFKRSAMPLNGALGCRNVAVLAARRS